MKRIFLASTLLAAGCATGFGEEATGFVEVSLRPAGDSSGGVRFDRAQLRIGSIEFVAAAQEEEPEDDGHGHAHGHLRSLAPGAAPEATAGDGHAHLLSLEPAAAPGATIDLLGGVQSLGSTEAPAGSYEAAHLIPAPATEGEAAGCSLFAAGETVIAGEETAVQICLPGGGEIELPLHLDVEFEETTELALLFDMGSLLQDVAVETLERGADGSVRIDATHNEAALHAIEESLPAAIVQAD